MTKHVVASTEELSDGKCKLVQVAGMEIGVLMIGGEHRAYRNFCPHAGAPLFTTRRGGVEYEPGSENESVRCPWHGWEFDLRTGSHVANPRCALDAHRTEVAGGTVFVWV